MVILPEALPCENLTEQKSRRTNNPTCVCWITTGSLAVNFFLDHGNYVGCRHVKRFCELKDGNQRGLLIATLKLGDEGPIKAANIR